MDEYIEREALYEKAYWHGEHPDVSNPFPDGVDAIDIEDVDAIPAADVVPVRHGYWRPIFRKDGKTDYECSCCLGIITDVPDDDEHDLCAWCSMCGAKMDLEG